jgi:hypothetical protein
MIRAAIAKMLTTATTRPLRADARTHAGRAVASACMTAKPTFRASTLVVNDADTCLAVRARRRLDAHVADGALLSP